MKLWFRSRTGTGQSLEKLKGKRPSINEANTFGTKELARIRRAWNCKVWTHNLKYIYLGELWQPCHKDLTWNWSNLAGTSPAFTQGTSPHPSPCTPPSIHTQPAGRREKCLSSTPHDSRCMEVVLQQAQRPAWPPVFADWHGSAPLPTWPSLSHCPAAEAQLQEGSVGFCQYLRAVSPNAVVLNDN